MKFQEAFEKVVVAEGGYANDPDDRGGETFMGIARRFNPASNLWKIVDAETKQGGSNREITKRLKANKEVVAIVRDIYYRRYWQPLHLEDITNDKLQYQLFDDAVNRGLVAAIRSLQHVLGMTTTGRISDELIYNANNYKA